MTSGAQIHRENGICKKTNKKKEPRPQAQLVIDLGIEAGYRGTWPSREQTKWTQPAESLFGLFGFPLDRMCQTANVDEAEPEYC